MTPTTLRFSVQLWQATLEALAPYRLRGVEGGCLWYGLRTGTDTHAYALGIPKQVNRPRNFEIPASALAELNTQISRRLDANVENMVEDMVVVAQIHSHPGDSTTHSPWDDAMMVSRKAFSLVLPHYAMLPCDLQTVGVHVHDGLHWAKLTQADGMRRFVLVGDSAQDAHLAARRGEAVVIVDTR